MLLTPMKGKKKRVIQVGPHRLASPLLETMYISLFPCLAVVIVLAADYNPKSPTIPVKTQCPHEERIESGTGDSSILKLFD